MTTSQKLIISSIFILILQSNSIFPQTYQKDIDYSKSINCLYNDNNSLEKIVFIDTTRRNIIKEYDVKGDNPFYQLLGISDSLARHSRSYAFSIVNRPVGELIDSAYRVIYDRQVDDSINVNYAYIQENVNYNYRNHIVVGNSVSLVHDMWSVGLMNQLKVFDEKGKLIYKYNAPNLNVTYSAITDNGKYLCYVYGWEDEGGYLIKYHYRIVDLLNNKIVTDVMYQTKYNNVIGIGSKYNLMLIGLDQAMKSHESIIYNFEKNKKYYKYFKWDEYQGVVLEKDGYIFNMENGETKTYNFENDFESEPL